MKISWISLILGVQQSDMTCHSWSRLTRVSV